MRIKILLIGNDPASTLADGLFLKERGLLVFTAFNYQNINELVTEIKPDVVFFDPHSATNEITDVYNEFVNSIMFTEIPVIFTLADDDVYLVTKKRTATKDKRTGITDNMIDAVKMALSNTNTHHKKPYKTHSHPQTTISRINFQ